MHLRSGSSTEWSTSHKRPYRNTCKPMNEVIGDSPTVTSSTYSETECNNTIISRREKIFDSNITVSKELPNLQEFVEKVSSRIDDSIIPIGDHLNCPTSPSFISLESPKMWAEKLSRKSSLSSTSCSEDNCLGILKKWLFETILDKYLDDDITEYTKILDNWLTILALHNMLNIIAKQVEKAFKTKLETHNKASLLKHWFEAEGIKMLLDRIKNGCSKPTEDHFKQYLKNWLDNPEIKSMMSNEVHLFLNSFSSENIPIRCLPSNRGVSVGTRVKALLEGLSENSLTSKESTHRRRIKKVESFLSHLSSEVLTSKEDISRYNVRNKEHRSRRCMRQVESFLTHLSSEILTSKEDVGASSIKASSSSVSSKKFAKKKDKHITFEDEYLTETMSVCSKIEDMLYSSLSSVVKSYQSECSQDL